MRPNETAMKTILADALEMWGNENEEDVRTMTFEEAGLLTRDAGIVAKVAGMEFQITIVRSK